MCSLLLHVGPQNYTMGTPISTLRTQCNAGLPWHDTGACCQNAHEPGRAVTSHKPTHFQFHVAAIFDLIVHICATLFMNSLSNFVGWRFSFWSRTGALECHEHSKPFLNLWWRRTTSTNPTACEATPTCLRWSQVLANFVTCTPNTGSAQKLVVYWYVCLNSAQNSYPSSRKRSQRWLYSSGGEYSSSGGRGRNRGARGAGVFWRSINCLGPAGAGWFWSRFSSITNFSHFYSFLVEDHPNFLRSRLRCSRTFVAVK